MKRICLLLCLLLGLTSSASGAERLARGLVALYDFEEGRGTTIRDQSGLATGLDLEIATPKAVRWQNGALVIDSSARIRSAGKATRLIEACQRSNELTLEVWVKPADDKQAGPARIISL